jgi:hypothetical protein
MLRNALVETHLLRRRAAVPSFRSTAGGLTDTIQGEGVDIACVHRLAGTRRKSGSSKTYTWWGTSSIPCLRRAAPTFHAPQV